MYSQQVLICVHLPLNQDCKCILFLLTICVQHIQERNGRPGLFHGIRRASKRSTQTGPAFAQFASSYFFCLLNFWLKKIHMSVRLILIFCPKTAPSMSGSLSEPCSIPHCYMLNWGWVWTWMWMIGPVKNWWSVQSVHCLLPYVTWDRTSPFLTI